METVRLQFPPHPRVGPTTVRRHCTNNRVASCIYLRSRPPSNTGLRLSLFQNSLPRWTYARAACLRTVISSGDRPDRSPTPVLEEEDETPNLKPKAWFYLFADAALCYLIWSPSENILRFVFVITSSIALPSVEFFRKFVREHIQDMSVRETRSRELEATLTSDCPRIALPSSSLEFMQDPNSEDEEDVTLTSRPKVWLYLFIQGAVCYLMRTPSENTLLLLFVITSSTALESVEFFGKFVQKYSRYMRLREFHSREAEEEAPSSHCPRTTSPSSSIKFRQGSNQEDNKRAACERNFFVQAVLLIYVVCVFFLFTANFTFALGGRILMPSLVALHDKLWTPCDVILAITFILTPCFLTAFALSVQHFLGYLLQFKMVRECRERERCKEEVKLRLCTKPQQIKEAEETQTTAYSRATCPPSFPQDKRVSGPTTREDYKANKFKRILLILFCFSVPVLCFYFFLVTALEAMQFGKSLLHPVALCYSLWTPSREMLRSLFPITSFLAMVLVGFFRMVLQEHLGYMQMSEYSEKERENKRGKGCKASYYSEAKRRMEIA